MIGEESFSEIIYGKRREKNMTQQELADKLHITDKAVSKWERGLSYPDVSLIPKLAEVLDISIENLINGKLEALEAKGGTGDIQAVTKLLEDSKSKTIHNVSRHLARHLVFRNMTILFAIAAVIISIVNVALSNTMTWGLYPLGAILMVWTVSAIFRFVTKRPTVYYAGLTVGGISVVLYCMLLEYLTKTQHWVSMLVIPLTGVTVIAGVLSIVIYTKRASNYWNLAGAVTLIFGVIAGPFYTYFISKYLHFSQIDTGNDVSFFAKIISLAILFAFSILFLVKGNTTHKGGEKR